MNECPNLAGCGFFKKYNADGNDLACNGYIRIYCKGEKQDECKRKIYKQENDVAPPDNMLPNGFFKKD